MSKHTPGPWFIDAKFRRFAEPGHVAISAQAHSILAQVVVRMDDDDADSDALIANARLIAAAPELLEALQSLVQTLKAAGYSTAHADAAIAKAAGGQQ